jgi:hypothetical protein
MRLNRRENPARGLAGSLASPLALPDWRVGRPLVAAMVSVIRLRLFEGTTPRGGGRGDGRDGDLMFHEVLC